MTILETAKVTSKGQVTIPNRVRKFLHLDNGTTVAFGVSKQGIFLLPCRVTAESPYTPEEWAKIEKLASQKGKKIRSTLAAKKYINAL